MLTVLPNSKARRGTDKHDPLIILVLVQRVSVPGFTELGQRGPGLTGVGYGLTRV
jgi:hypothetical protein